MNMIIIFVCFQKMTSKNDICLKTFSQIVFPLNFHYSDFFFFFMFFAEFIFSSSGLFIVKMFLKSDYIFKPLIFSINLCAHMFKKYIISQVQLNTISQLNKCSLCLSQITKCADNDNIFFTLYV